jgi:hypothetical protein
MKKVINTHQRNMKSTQSNLLLFETLWAIVRKSINKGDENATTHQLENVLNKAQIEPKYPYKPLPNVREFRITELAPYDPVLSSAGIQRRLWKAEYDSTKYTNHRMNRYVKHQFKRLNSSISNPRKFWAIANRLLNTSYSYRTICFNHVFPNWHRDMPYYIVKNILKSLISMDLRKYRYKVKHIPKNETEVRPLGIPSPSWRIYLHGYNNILMVWLNPYIHPSQHGFIPGRGTLTAWQSLITRIESRSIYEFDMKKFFDSVNLDYLSRTLRATGLPLE